MRAQCYSMIAVLALMCGMVTASVAHAKPAMRMYRDPQTGRIGAPPPVEPDPGAAAATSQAVAPLVQEAVTVPAGGVKVNLRGRYRAAVTRGLSPRNGGAVHECVQSNAGEHE
ncbi:MAG: hypothetical protein AB7N53_07385 [Candidatus Binatia bacterium]